MAAQPIPPLDETGAMLSPAEVKAISQESYLFGLPLVYIGLELEAETNVAKPEGLRAPINQFGHVREFPDAKANPVVGMNVDTLYSIAHLDLTKEPIVISVPDMGSRWWIMQLLDAWNDVPAAPGYRTVGGRGGNFAIVGPNWKGKLPAALSEIRCDTNLVMVIGRTYTNGQGDYVNVHKAQNGYKLTPLSKWGTDYTPPANVPIKPGMDTKTPIPNQVFALSPEAFFSRLSDLLSNNPPRPSDAPVVARMAKLGIVPGKKFRTADFDYTSRKAIEDGVLAAQKKIRDGQAHMGDMVNGWQIARDLGRYETKYAYRATWTFYGVGGNLVEDACYPITIADSNGKALTGKHNYIVTFPKGQLPPVNAFWSVTMYDADSYLVPNILDRYALGDRDKLRFNDDGSLTLYVQHDLPGNDKEDNWLPAPKNEFKLAMRLYAPKQSVADGTWKPAPLERVE